MTGFNDDYLGKPRSFEDIEALVGALCKTLNTEIIPKLNIAWLIECVFTKLFPHAAVIPVSSGEIKGALGLTLYEPSPRILLRKDVYIGLNNTHPKSRFIAAHEFGHLVMHSTLPKSLKDGVQEKILLKNASSMSLELQANYFAVALLIPRKYAKTCSSIYEIVDKFNVPIELARLAIDLYKLNTEKMHPYQLCDLAQREDSPFLSDTNFNLSPTYESKNRKIQPYKRMSVEMDALCESAVNQKIACFLCGRFTLEATDAMQKCCTCNSTSRCH